MVVLALEIQARTRTYGGQRASTRAMTLNTHKARTASSEDMRWGTVQVHNKKSCL